MISVVASLIFLTIDAYLSVSLLGPFHHSISPLFWILFAALQSFIAAQLWLFFFFFKSDADHDLIFEKHIQRYAFFSMGMISFLVVFTLARDITALLAGYFNKNSDFYTIPNSIGIILLSSVCFLIGALVARFRVSSPKIQVNVANLPTALTGLKIVQMSDIHLGTGPGTAHVSDMVNRALSLKPDLIVLTGDIIDGNIRDIQSELDQLERLKAPLGVYFILGNHECYWNWRESVQALKKISIVPLLNEGIELNHNGEKFFLAGINDPSITQFGGEAPKVPVPPTRSRLNIALIHQPQLAGLITQVEPRYHLQLSGHTHGGQFFPWNLIVNRMYPIAKGLGKIKHLWVYVNQGTGYWGPPIRLGTTGEVTDLSIC